MDPKTAIINDLNAIASLLNNDFQKAFVDTAFKFFTNIVKVAGNTPGPVAEVKSWASSYNKDAIHAAFENPAKKRDLQKKLSQFILALTPQKAA
jgi:hypothetical protein